MSARILVTAGGGKDGEALFRLVIDALAPRMDDAPRMVWVLGPLMKEPATTALHRETRRFPSVVIQRSALNLAETMAACDGAVAMGGYGTFCDLIRARLPAVIVPRRSSNPEQAQRAADAARLGFARVVAPPGEDAASVARSVADMAEAIRWLESAPAVPDNSALLCGSLRERTRSVVEAGRVDC